LHDVLRLGGAAENPVGDTEKAASRADKGWQGVIHAARRSTMSCGRKSAQARDNACEVELAATFADGMVPGPTH
jgi:hypothetical protein